MQCERMRAILELSRILLLGTNHPIVTYQGNTIGPGLVTTHEIYQFRGARVGVTKVCGWGAYFTNIVQQ